MSRLKWIFIWGILLLWSTMLAAQSSPDNFFSLQFNQVTPLNRGMAHNYDHNPLFEVAGMPFAIGLTVSKFPEEDKITEFQITQTKWQMASDQPVEFSQDAIFMRLKRAFPFQSIPLTPYAGFGIGLNLADFNYGYLAQIDDSQPPVRYTANTTYLAFSGQVMGGFMWLPTKRIGFELEVCYQLDYFDNRGNGNLGFLGFFQVLPALVVTF